MNSYKVGKELNISRNSQRETRRFFPQLAEEPGGRSSKRIGISDCLGESAPYQRLLAKNGIAVEAVVSAWKSML